MPVRNIVRGQKLDPAKAERARQFRRTMTPEERTLWQALRGNRMPGLHFRRQQVIAGFIVDFYCHNAGLAVEVDGGVHKKLKEYDEERDRILSDRGVQVLRIRSDLIVTNLNRALALIAAAAKPT